MGKRTEYSPGTFSWCDLSTPDQQAAGAFYAGLFGWDLAESPMGEGQVYVIASLGGDSVAAISPQPEQQRSAGVPPLWNSYVTVESADRAAEVVAEHGGSVHAGPFDVFDAGRMAVCTDPQGGFFMVWEPKSNIGAGLVNAPGALSWNELTTPDPQGAISFYGGVFGWSFSKAEGMPFDYWMCTRADGGSNGGMHAPLAGEPTGWLVYFACSGLDASLAKIEELGGGRINGPQDVGPARFAVVRDPQGAVFALYDGPLED